MYIDYTHLPFVEFSTYFYIPVQATRNSVPVPRHWCFKRKYLQGKRGIEKPPFDLPDFIKATGIMEMRLALQEKVIINLKNNIRGHTHMGGWHMFGYILTCIQIHVGHFLFFFNITGRSENHEIQNAGTSATKNGKD